MSVNDIAEVSQKSIMPFTSQSTKPYLDLLPNEIVARILDFGNPGSLLWFSHVCRRFKEVVYEHPVFSGKASLHSLGTTPPTQGSFNLFLKQLSCSSNPINVDLILTSFLSAKMAEKLIEALANNLHRITSLLLQINMNTEADGLALIRALSQPAPKMRWFRFGVSARLSPAFPHLRAAVPLPSTLFGGAAPQLRTVLISLIPGEIIPAFATVHHLLMVTNPIVRELANLRPGFPALQRLGFSIRANLDHDPEIIGLLSTPVLNTIKEMRLSVHPVLSVLPAILGHLQDNGPLSVRAISRTEHMQPGHPGLFNLTIESQTTGYIRNFVEIEMNQLKGVGQTFTSLKIDERVASLSVSAPDLHIVASLFPRLPGLKSFEVSLTRESLIETFYPPVLKEDDFNPDEEDPDFEWLSPSIDRIECPNLEKVIVTGTGNLTCSAAWLAFLAGHVLGATARARFELELRGVQHVGDINDILGGHFDSVTMRREIERRWDVQPRIIKSPPRPPRTSESET